MRRWTRSLLFGLALGLGGAILVLTPTGHRFEERVGLTTLFRLRGPVEPPPQVAIVNLDEASAVHLGLPLLPREWPRSLHGRLIDALVARGVVVVAFDMSFERPQPVEDDVALARSIGRANAVILYEAIERRQPVLREGEPPSQVWLELLRRPLPIFANAAAGLAPFPLPKVPGTVQQFFAFLPHSGDRPTLPVVTLQAYASRVDPAWDALFETLSKEFVGNTPLKSATPAALGDDASFALSLRQIFESNGELARRLQTQLAAAAAPTGGSTHLPSAEQVRAALIELYRGPSRHYLNHYGPPGTIRHIPYHTVLGEEQTASDAPALSGVAIFVGYSELMKPSKLDGFETVFHRGDGVDTSGVEIAATAFANLLTDSTIEPLSPGVTILSLTAAGLMLGLIVLWLPLQRVLLAAVPAAVAYTVLAFALFSRQQLWLPLAVPLLVQLPLALLGGALGQYLLALQRQRDLQREKADADAASLAKSGFVAFVIHDLRNRMSGVIGFMELLGKTPLDRAQQSLVAEARDSSNSALKIVNDVLDSSKIEARELQLNPEAFDPLTLAHRVVESVRPFAQAKDLPLRLEPKPPLPPAVVSDPLRLEQILANLLDNAIKFTVTGAVTLRVRADDRDGLWGDRLTLLFQVCDTGIGIDRAALGTIFQPFRQASAATPQKFGGTGLGLSIARHLAELLGGDLAVTSVVGEGSVFTLRLPVVLPLPMMAVRPPGAAAPELALSDHHPCPLAGRSPTSVMPGREVLVVEDHPITRRLLEAQLRRLGYAARFATDGEDAWSTLLREPAGIIITDLHMPRLDGAGLAHRLRADRRLGHTWIIGLTADSLDDADRFCRETGMNRVLPKPATLAAIAEALAAAPFADPSGEDQPPAGASDEGDGADLSRLPVFDKANLREAYGSMDEPARHLLRGFIDETADRLAAIRRHVADRRSRPLAQAAHRLAGACLVMGATRLGEICRRMEGLAIADRWESIDPLLQSIEASFSELTRAVVDSVDDQQSTS